MGEFKEVYRARAGVEALVSEATNGLDSRRSRYFGLAKTHLNNVLTAAAINLGRVAVWTETVENTSVPPADFSICLT